MLYFENASRGVEGFNTHVMSYTLAASLANFLDRPFYFDFEIPSSTPPDFAFDDQFRERFSLLLTSERSLVSDLITTPVRRVQSIDRGLANKLELQLVYSHFVTTEDMTAKFGGTIIWDSFSAGRIPLTREYLRSFDLIDWTHSKLSHTAFFYFLPRPEKAELLESVRLAYLEPIERLAKRIIEQLGPFNSAHLRFGDFERMYRQDDFAIDPLKFNLFLKSAFSDGELPLLVATDGLHEKDRLRQIFAGVRLIFVDELILDEFGKEFRELPFTDFNVITVLDQLIAAAGIEFVGTYRSTFTGIIHRLRQERYGRRDFNFFPDEKVARLIDPNGRIVPDMSGFFDWNRFSVFAEDHASMAWKREWDRELSAI